MNAPVSVAVLIPYYQKREGILRRALTSVLAQNLPADVSVDVIVVDDGSPIPAKGEIVGLSFAPPFNLILKEQPNGGVAAARNTGLNTVAPETTYIAFLDSDDVWDPEHLPRALRGLWQGKDLYFCDNERKNSHDSWLSLISFTSNNNHLSPVSIAEDIYAVDNSALFDVCLRHFVIQLSTLVYEKGIAPNLLFDSYLSSSEDHLFVLRLLEKSRHACYSPCIAVSCLDGVNIWFGRFGWDSPNHTLSQLCQAIAAGKMLKGLSLSSENRRFLAARTRTLRLFYAYLALRDAFKQRRFLSKEQLKIASQDATFWRWFPLCLLYVAFLYPLRLYSPISGDA